MQAQNTQNTFSNNLLLGVIAALAAVTLVNTLAIATSERRRSVRLLARTGATARQATGMFGWTALFVTVAGTGAGALLAAGPLIVIDRLESGAAVPYIPLAQAAAVVGAVALLTAGTIMAALRVAGQHADHRDRQLQLLTTAEIVPRPPRAALDTVRGPIAC